MRKLTGDDMANLAGITIGGYHIDGVRVKHGDCSDSDHYGIMLGRNERGHYVTWQLRSRYSSTEVVRKTRSNTVLMSA